MPFCIPNPGAEPPRKNEAQPQGQYGPKLPPDGWHVVKIIGVQRGYRTSGGKLCDKLQVEAQYGYRDFPVFVACGEDGQPRPGDYGLGKLLAIAAALGYQPGQPFDYEDLMGAPLRANIAITGKYRNVLEWRTCTPSDREELREFLARSAHVSEPAPEGGGM